MWQLYGSIWNLIWNSVPCYHGLELVQLMMKPLGDAIQMWAFLLHPQQKFKIGPGWSIRSVRTMNPKCGSPLVCQSIQYTKSTELGARIVNKGSLILHEAIPLTVSGRILARILTINTYGFDLSLFVWLEEGEDSGNRNLHLSFLTERPYFRREVKGKVSNFYENCLIVAQPLQMMR